MFGITGPATAFMLTVRAAAKEDAEGIQSVSKHLGYAELSDEETREKLEQLLSSEDHFIYIAEREQRVLGWIHLFTAYRLASPSFCEIGGLVVDPNYRKQGIGRALVEHAVDRHGGTVRVRCNEKRQDTHVFYQSIGFEDVKVQRIFEK
ncbi:MAG: GNAT family N-acetyltransferase [Pseudomonadota bacterium]